MSLLSLAASYFRRRLLLTLSALCIALGVAVLFAVLAVVNGFLDELQGTLREFGGDVVVRPRNAPVAARSADYLAAIRPVPGVRSAAPRANWFGLVGRRGSRALADPRSADLGGLLLVGLEPELEGRNQALLGGLGAGEVSRRLTPGSGGLPRILLGQRAAEGVGVAAGDALEVISFQSQEGGDPYPVRGSFEVGGTFKTGQYEQDLDRAVVLRSALVQFAGLRSDFTEIAVRTAPGADPVQVAAAVQDALVAAGLALPDWPQAVTWRQQRSNLLAAVENQRGILGTVFFFIVLVAAYQLLATLTLTVAEKRRDIGVLSTLGASPARVARFFVSLGLVIASSGLTLGLGLGWLLIRNIDAVDRLISGGEGFFNPEVYQFDEIPTSVHASAVLLLAGGTLAASLLFSLLPAWRAARMPVVRALRSA